MGKKIIIADASPLIAFGRIEQISLIQQVLGHIIITDIVAGECMGDLAKPGAKQIDNAIKTSLIEVHKTLDSNEYEELMELLGAGEASAIALAVELQTGLLIDEKLGRGAAEKLNIDVIGTAGVLLLAKKKKIIKKVKPVIMELKSAGYYLSAALIKEVLERARE